MGNTTPNIGIYVPVAGEQNYDQAFAAGMVNIDEHDHTGGPNKGLPITSSGIGAGAIDYTKLNANVADAAPGVQAGAGALGANQIATIGILKNIYQNADPSGFFAKTGVGVVAARTFKGTTNQIAITNGAGIAGDPVISLSPLVRNVTQPCFSAIVTLSQNNKTGDNTDYTVQFETELRDQSSNYDATTGVFTAPATGNYLFTVSVGMTGIVAANNSNMKFVVNGVTQYLIFRLNTNPITGGSQFVGSGSVQIFLANGDTVTVVLQVNQSSKVINVVNGYFTGALIC